MIKKIIALLICGLIFVTGCNKKNINDDNNNPIVVGPSANINNEIIKEQTIDGLKFTNIVLISEGDHAKFSSDIVNTTGENINVKSFSIIYKDKDGNEIVQLLGYIGSTISPNQSITLTADAEINLSHATSVQYVRNY